MRENSKTAGDAMRLNCIYCNEVLTSNSRPSGMVHKNTGQFIFTSYLHCPNCGATSKAEVFLEGIREPFKQDDLLEQCA